MISEDDSVSNPVCVAGDTQPTSNSFLGIKDLAVGIFQLVKLCIVDPAKATHSFKIENATIDIMFRRNLLMAISFDRPDDDDDDEDNANDDKNSDTDNTSKEENIEEIETNKTQKEEEIEIEKKQEEKEEWTTVSTKKPKKIMDLVVFADHSSSQYIDQIDRVKTLQKVEELALTHDRCHAFDTKTKTLYDYKFGHRISTFQADGQYLKKYELSKNNNDDKRDFYLFDQAVLWHNWNFVCKLTGLGNVRRHVKEQKFQWAHCFEKETNTLFNFSVVDGALSQKKSTAPDKYMQRFSKLKLIE